MSKRWYKRLENIFAAVTFAEAGEFDAAKQIIAEQRGIEHRENPDAPRIVEKDKITHDCEEKSNYTKTG